MLNQTPIELLSPAKNYEIGVAAINHGADAVYIGFERFGAREAAGNSLSDIEKLIRYAHIYHARVYITINTILYDNELNEVDNLIHTFYKMGADAIIIQDLGILEMDLPPIPIHASTQTNNTSLEKVKFLENIGIQRVILARELNLDEIKHIRKHTTVELEAFIHGALCVSYSGQCYFSQAIAGRSANRGECAQPCRSKYDLVDSSGKVLVKGKHLLSLKDLNQTKNIGFLIDSGITSLKIEGRLKDIVYVKNITAHYRKVIDRHISNRPYYSKSSSGKVNLNFDPDPENSFNRTFTTHFTEGRQRELISIDTQKSVGKYVGTVSMVAKNWLSLSGEHKITNNDGLCFVNKIGELEGFKVNRVEENRIYPNRRVDIVKDTKVFRNYDHSFTQELLSNTSSARTIDCKIYMRLSNNLISIELIDEDLISTSFELSNNFENSEKGDLALATLKKQFQKTGNTPFVINSMEVTNNTNDVPFIPIGQINEWRRKLVEMHTLKRIEKHSITRKRIKPNSTPYSDNILTYKANVSNSLAKKFYNRHGVEEMEEAYEINKNHLGVEIMETKYCPLYELGYCITPKGQITIKKDLFLKNNEKLYPLLFNCHECKMIVKLDKFD